MSNNLIGATLAIFTVTLSAAVTEPVDVAWSTRDGTAKAGTDYEAANGVITFLPGETAKQVQVTVYGQDDITAADKNFYIELSPPSNAVLGVTIIEVVISIDDEDGVSVLSLVVPQGKRGLTGNPGLSAYEQAVFMGHFTGTVEEWMEEVGSASSAAVRAEGFAADAAESAVVAEQKATETTQIGDAKIAAVNAAGDEKITAMNDIAITVTAMTDGKWYFKTEALLLANKPQYNTAAKALDTKKVWFWETTNGGATGTWTDTGLSELDLAKADATAKANAAEANAKSYADTNKLDFSDVLVGYIDGNLIGPKSTIHTNLGLTAGSELSESTNLDSVVIPVTPGQELYIKNTAAAFVGSLGGRKAFFATDPNKNRTQTALAHTSQLVSGANVLTHWKVTVPEGANFLMLPTRITSSGTTINMVWAVHEGAYSSSYDVGEETLVKINGSTVGPVIYKKINQAETNAKTYADNRAKLARPIIASNKVSRLIQDTANTQVALGDQSIPTISLVVGSYVYAINVKPNTTYTLVSTVTGAPTVREFAAEPISEVSRLEALVGQTITTTTYQSTPVLRRGGTFTTGENTNYITLDPRTYSNYDFVVVEGEYAEDIEASLVATVDQSNKQASFDYLYAKNLQSDKFGKSKNLFKGYTFGSYLSTTRIVSSDYVSGLWLPGYHPTLAGFWEGVATVVPVKPNTTYTISKEESNRFAVLLCKDLTNSKLVLRDSSLRSYTVTTGSEDNFIAIVLSDIGEQPLVQIEEGTNVTAYESMGDKFAKSALPIGKKLTDIVKQTDNAYISLGMQSDEFRYYPTAPTQWTTDTVLNKYYEPLRAEFPANITRNILGKDASGLYDVYEYILKPDNYEQTIFITAGMHTTEMVTPFALGILLNEIYRNPSKHEGLAYLRNKVKIVVIPVVNVWGANQNPKVVPTHYVNSNAVNPSRNFPERWEQIIEDGPYNKKGTAPASEAETQHIMTVMHREKDELAFYLDLHTGQGWTQDTLLYWLEEDNFLRPVLQNIVSMRNDIVRKTLGREPINETHETQRATSLFYLWRVLGVPAGTIEYGTGSTSNLDNTQTTYYVDLVFNSIHYALKANLKAKRKQVELNEHNKQFISLYNTLSAHNNVVNQVWNYAQLQTNLYDKLGLTKSVIGAASGTYSLVKYVHAPAGYKNTVVLSAGLRGKDTRKSVTELGFFAHKLMTDLNPHIVALRNSTRFIFIPCLNPHGYDNNIVNNANAVQPYLNFSTSTQPEPVALRSLIDAETIDLFVDIDSLLNANKPSDYANLQMIYNAKADIEYGSIFSVLNAKYAVSNPANAASYSTALVKSQVADYINGKGVAYIYSFFAQNVLPLRTTVEGKYTDLGYEANELAYCSEVLLNSIKEICQRRTLSKYLSN